MIASFRHMGLKAFYEARAEHRVATRPRGRCGLRGPITEKQEKIMALHAPPHPGGVMRRQCLEPLRLTVTSRHVPDDVLGRRGVPRALEGGRVIAAIRRDDGGETS